MNRMSRRKMIRFGGLAAAGIAGTLVLPGRLTADTALTEGSQYPDGVLESGSEAMRGKPPKKVKATALEPGTEPVTDPSLTLYRALDTDFGMHGVQPQSWFDSAHAAGYDGFITTLHTYWGGKPSVWLPSHDALRRALAAGMWIGAYGRPVTHWREALNHLPTDLRAALKFYALDVEPEPNGNLPVRREYVDGVASMGVRPVIYSGWGMWGDVMGKTALFADVPLWDFSGDRTDWPLSLTEANLVEYGGWNTTSNLRSGWQVQMQTEATLNGINIDRDVFSREFIDAV